MKIIVCHNFYKHSGGEDSVFRDEVQMLRDRGDDVVEFTRHNSQIDRRSKWSVAVDAVWNRRISRELMELVRRERADVVHVHNTWPLLSPSVFRAARSAGAAVVQTIHNYRFFCAGATCFRDGNVCDDCCGKLIPWPALRNGCYRDSRAATAAMAATMVAHRALATYRRHVDRFIVLSQFAREKLVAGGLPREKTAIKPNFVAELADVGDGAGGYAMFLGRLSPEKGVLPMLAAWRTHSPRLRLVIVGDGPLLPHVEETVASGANVDYRGRMPFRAAIGLLRDASMLVLPSTNYEGFPRTIVEAFSVGTPVVASRLGSMIELVDDQATGAHFAPGNPSDLAAAVNRLADSPELLASMRLAARREYVDRYTPDQNFAQLHCIYAEAIAARHGVTIDAYRRAALRSTSARQSESTGETSFDAETGCAVSASKTSE